MGEIRPEIEAWLEVYWRVSEAGRNDALTPLWAFLEVSPGTIRNWASGRTIPSATKWKTLVVMAELEHEWATLSAARDFAVTTRGKRGRKPVSEVEQLRRKSAKLSAKADALEVQDA